MVADVRMPGMDGIELVRELGRRKLALPVVLISGHADVPMAVAAIKAGRRGLHREAGRRCPAARRHQPLPGAQPSSSFDANSRGSELRGRNERLTPRESRGDGTRRAGVHQCSHCRCGSAISHRTVESYRVQIMDKMQAESVAVLVRQAIRLGRITP